MKYLTFFLLIIGFFIVFCSFGGCKENKEKAEDHIWIYKDGYHLNDLIGFSDNRENFFRINSKGLIYKNDTCLAILVSVNNSELIIQSFPGGEKGIYDEFETIEFWDEKIKESQDTAFQNSR